LRQFFDVRTHDEKRILKVAARFKPSTLKSSRDFVASATASAAAATAAVVTGQIGQ
jgi:hypothetical protein